MNNCFFWLNTNEQLSCQLTAYNYSSQLTIFNYTFFPYFYVIILEILNCLSVIYILKLCGNMLLVCIEFYFYF